MYHVVEIIFQFDLNKYIFPVISEPCRKVKECFKTSSDNPLVIKKVKKQLFIDTYLFFFFHLFLLVGG